MALKLLSKNNMGVASILILAILSSQPKMFGFLTDTHLGRIGLIALVIFIAHVNKIMGLVAVLIIIIAHNHHGINVVHGYNYYEGFDVSGNITDMSGNIADMSGNTILAAKEKIVKEKAKIINNKLNKTTTSTSSAASGTEGFCMSDREINMLRGKQSNSIKVLNNSREQADNIMPSDMSVFSGVFASF